MPNEGERLQKVMAQAGVASRRASEAMIIQGRVAVNGRIVTELGTRVDPTIDRVTVDGRLLGQAEALTYVALYKPAGYLSSNQDPHGGHMLVELLPPGPRLYPVGRLDRDSEGLMLLTNDGELALRLTHPRYGQEKEYRVLVDGRLRPDDVAALEQGIELPGKARPAQARVLDLGPGWRWHGEPVPEGCEWIGVLLSEGHKREIREMLGSLGLPVIRLIRVRIAGLELGALEPGQHRRLNRNEILQLLDQVGLDRKESKIGTDHDRD